jgi:hypothetical protein
MNIIKAAFWAAFFVLIFIELFFVREISCSILYSDVQVVGDNVIALVILINPKTGDKYYIEGQEEYRKFYSFESARVNVGFFSPWYRGFVRGIDPIVQTGDEDLLE